MCGRPAISGCNWASRNAWGWPNVRANRLCARSAKHGNPGARSRHASSGSPTSTRAAAPPRCYRPSSTPWRGRRGGVWPTIAGRGAFVDDDRRGAMQYLTRLCVYCGSAAGFDARYQDAARELGGALAKAGIELIFGGGRVGLMGVLADAVLAGGGRVVGIIPRRLRDAELAHPGAGELVIVGSMHERKRQMAERADAFAILPGGIGTLDE